MRRVFVIVVILLGGCGEDPVEYDAVRDKCYIHFKVCELAMSKKPNVETSFSGMLNGDGKYPAEWNCTLFLDVRKPKGAPDVLGAMPVLIIRPYDSTEYKGLMIKRASGELWEEEQAMIGLTIDDLVKFIESKPEIDGTPIPLTKEDADRIRKAIVAARERTNASR